MSKKLSFSIAINLLTEQFKRGAHNVKNSLRSIQAQVVTFATALGVGGIGLFGLISRFREVTRETSRVLTALKNVSGGSLGFADNLRYLNDLADKYGQNINNLIGSYSRFTASATQANLPMEEQRKIFEAVTRASVAFGLSGEESKGVMLALSQMMSKGKISAEELRKQMGEKLPIALQAMAKGAGLSMQQLENHLKQGKLISAKVLPKFATALNEMLPNVDTDNLETSLSRLENTFTKIANQSGFKEKYKAGVDGLTKALEKASQNIQNIFVGLMAFVAFVVGRGLTKIFAHYKSVGQQIITNAEITQKKLLTATAERVEAEKTLETLKSEHAIAQGRRQSTLANQIAKAEKTLDKKRLAETIAMNKAVEASANATAIKSAGFWGTATSAIVGTAKKAVTALKGLWNSFAPALVLGVITALIGKMVTVYNEAKRIKRMFSEYKAEATSATNTQEIVKLKELQKIATDVKKSYADRVTAINSINKELGKNYKLDKNTLKINGDINKSIADRIKLLEAQAKADFYIRKKIESEDKINSIYNKYGGKNLFIEKYGATKKKYNRFSYAKGSLVSKMWENSEIALEGAEILQLEKIIEDASRNINSSLLSVGKSTTNLDVVNSDVDDETKKIAENKLEALRKLDELDRKRALDKRKFDLEQRQIEAETLNDGFERELKLLKVKLDKEELELDEHYNTMLKEQKDYLKESYIAKHGKDDGFESFFVSAQAQNFKDTKGKDLLPEGLRNEDLLKVVSIGLDSLKKLYIKSFQEVNSELNKLLTEQEVAFASNLDKQLYDIDAYYSDLINKVKGNEEAENKIKQSHNKARQVAILNDNLRKADYKELLEVERANNFASVGMTEYAEAKKLEIFKKFAKEKIKLLRELGKLGDDEATRQINILEAQLSQADNSNVTLGVKGFIDKKIADTLIKAFVSADKRTDVDAKEKQEQAEEKVSEIFAKIRKKASIVASIAGEIKNIFGGLNEELDLAVDTIGNIAGGFASGGIAGGILATLAEGVKFIKIGLEAEERHTKAIAEIAEAKIKSQREYNLLLLEQNLLLKEASSVFGENHIAKAVNSMKNYREAYKQLQGEIAGSEKGNQKAIAILELFDLFTLASNKKRIERYKKGVGKLGEASVVTGHKKTGLFGWGKGKKIYTSILEINEYKDIYKDGKLNKEMAKTILNTREMSNSTKEYLQNLIKLQDHLDKAQDDLRNYLHNTFGALGNELMDNIESAIVDRSVNAWEKFGEAGSKVIEKLGKQLAYDLFFADEFKKLEKDLEEAYKQDKNNKEISKDVTNIYGNFYKGLKNKAKSAEDFLLSWQDFAKKQNLSLWKPEVQNQSTTKGYSTEMSQDTGGALLGRATGIHEAILGLQNMLSTSQVNSVKINSNISNIYNELQKQTGILYEIQQVQMKSYKVAERTNENITSLLDIKEDISSMNRHLKKL